jgi:hypothetical protein
MEISLCIFTLDEAGYRPVHGGAKTSQDGPALLVARLTRSSRDNVALHWRQESQKHDASGFNTKLLFGAGGKYDADTMHLRAEMLHHVEADVGLMNQDLAALAAAL